MKLRKQNSDPADARMRGYLERNKQSVILGGERGVNDRSHGDISSDLQRVFQRVVHH